MDKRMRVHPRHWTILLDFLELHPELITGKFSTINAKQKSNDLWTDITNKLNALGLGTKTTEKWKVALTDWKCKVKAKCQIINKSRRDTGGGPENDNKLNENECRLMSLIGWSGVKGVDTELVECGLKANVSSNIDKELEANNDNQLSLDETLSEDKEVSIPTKKKKITHTTENTPSIKKKGEKDLEMCHEETLNILNDINANIKQLTKNCADIALAINNNTSVLSKIEVTLTSVLGTNTTSEDFIDML